ncbi:MAG: mechanosensitive ion channel family protein [Myxococcota bacterium]
MPSRRFLAGTLASLWLLAAPAFAQAAAPAEPSKQQTAPVVVDGAVLMRVRGVSVYPAEVRAAAIAAQIVAFARDASVPADAVRQRSTGSSTVVEAGSYRLMEVLVPDAEIEGVSHQILARAVAGRIASAVKTYREERTPRALVLKAVRLAAAAIACALLLWLVHRAVLRLELHLERRFRPALRDVGVQAFSILRAEQLWAALRAALGALRVLPALFLALWVLDYGLRLFPWTRSAGLRLGGVLRMPLVSIGGGLIEIAPNLVFLAIWILVVRYMLTLARLFFAAVGSGAITMRGFDPEWAEPTYRIARTLAIAFALVVAFPYVPGSDSQAFRGLSLFFGVVFSLGSSSVVGNLIAGYTMLYRRAYRLGDRIRVADVMGEVIDSRLLVTHVRTAKNEEVVIPNSLILQSSVTNFSSLAKTRKLLLHTTVGIGYETPWRQVEAMLLEAAARTDGVLRDPAPFVLLLALADFAVTYELNVFTEDPTTMLPQYTRIHRNVLDVFNEHGVQIMTPAYEGDPPEPKVVPRERWFEAPARPPQPTR